MSATALPESSDQLISADARPALAGIRFFRMAATAMAAACAGFLFVFGLGLIPGLQNEQGSFGLVAIYAAATFLVLCAAVGWVWFGRIARQTALTLELTPDGFVAGLVGGRSVSTSWNDPRFGAKLATWTQTPNASGYLQWTCGGQRFAARVTPEGGRRLVEEARRHGLVVTVGPASPRGPQMILMLHA